MRSFCTIDSSDAGVGWRLAGLFLWVSFYQIVAENAREVWQDWSMVRRGWEGRIWAWLSEGYRAPLAWWGWGWVREAIKIKLNPFLKSSGGWVPDWRNMVTRLLCRTLCLPPWWTTSISTQTSVARPGVRTFHILATIWPYSAKKRCQDNLGWVSGVKS